MRTYLTLLFILMLVCCRSNYKSKDAIGLTDVHDTIINDSCINLYTNTRQKPGVYAEILNKMISISSDDIKVVIQNNTHDSIEFGDMYYLEEKVNNQWHRIPLDIDTLGNMIAFNAIGYSLKPQQYVVKDYSLVKIAHKYKVGDYRIIIPYSIGGNESEMISGFYLVD